MAPLTGYIAIDPGKQTGWAEFSPFGSLARCGLARPPFATIPRGVPLLVVELPHGGQGKASRKDLVTLTLRIGAIIAHVGAREVVQYEPRRWKGTIDGDIMTRRVRDRWMEPGEIEILNRIRACHNHNVIDSIGIGIWYAAIRGLRVLP